MKFQFHVKNIKYSVAFKMLKPRLFCIFFNWMLVQFLRVCISCFCMHSSTLGLVRKF